MSSLEETKTDKSSGNKLTSNKLNFKVLKLEKFRWKKDRDHMLNLIAEKN